MQFTASKDVHGPRQHIEDPSGQKSSNVHQ
jgi:hypothetical protein